MTSATIPASASADAGLQAFRSALVVLGVMNVMSVFFSSRVRDPEDSPQPAPQIATRIASTAAE